LETSLSSQSLALVLTSDNINKNNQERETQITQNTTTQKVALVNSTIDALKKIRLRQDRQSPV